MTIILDTTSSHQEHKRGWQIIIAKQRLGSNSFPHCSQSQPLVIEFVKIVTLPNEVTIQSLNTTAYHYINWFISYPLKHIPNLPPWYFAASLVAGSPLGKKERVDLAQSTNWLWSTPVEWNESFCVIVEKNQSLESTRGESTWESIRDEFNCSASYNCIDPKASLVTCEQFHSN